MILADTTIWVDHFRRGDQKLVELLEQQEILLHPFIVAELALGSLKDRASTLGFLDAQPTTKVASTAEIRSLVESRLLYARGIGLIDAHLIASALLTPGTNLWTRDGRLRGVARAMNVLADLP
jgi:predicted nucleic acid-binding protein